MSNKVRRILLAFLVGLVVFVWIHRLLHVTALDRAQIKHEEQTAPWEADPCPTCSYVHKPKAGCPQDTEELKNFFTEGDGSQLNACYRSRGDGATDYLMPGESMVMSFDFDLPDDVVPRVTGQPRGKI